MNHDEVAKTELKPLERPLAKPTPIGLIECAVKPIIQCCFAFESGVPFEEHENQLVSQAGPIHQRAGARR